MYGFVCVSFALSLFPLDPCFTKQVMDRLSSSTSTAPSIDDYFEQEDRIVIRGLFISMLITDEDPFFHKGLSSKNLQPGSRRVSNDKPNLTYEMNSKCGTKKTTDQNGLA